MSRFLVVVCAVAGCGSTALTGGGDGGTGDAAPVIPANVALPRDGKRLKAIWYVTPEGQPSFAGWRDTRLGVDCALRFSSDGALRCVPEAISVAFRFEDPACTIPLVAHVKGCTVPAYASRTDSTTCKSQLSIHRLSEPVAMREFYENFSGACTRASSGDLVVRRLGQEMAPSTFVRMQEGPEPDPEGRPLIPLWLEGDDGSRQPAGLRLAGTLQECLRSTMEDGKERCLPLSGSTTESTFADSTCSQPLVSHRPACGPAPTMGRRRLPGACFAEPALYEVGPRVASAFEVRAADNMCVPATLAADREYWSLGERIPDETFPLIDVVTEPGPQRLRRRTYALPGGQVAHAGWFDADRGETCGPDYLDGKWRCVPFENPQYHTSFFADDKCFQAVLARYTTSCQPARPIRYIRAVAWRSASCSPRTLVHRITGPYVGPIFLRRFYPRGPGLADESCEPTHLPPELTDLQRAEVVSPSEFAELRVAQP